MRNRQYKQVLDLLYKRGAVTIPGLSFLINSSLEATNKIVGELLRQEKICVFCKGGVELVETVFEIFHTPFSDNNYVGRDR